MAFKRVVRADQTNVPQPRRQAPQQQMASPQGESSLGSLGRNLSRQGVRNLPLLGATINPALGAGLLAGELTQGLSRLAESATSYLPQGFKDFFNSASGNISPSQIAQSRQGRQDIFSASPTGDITDEQIAQAQAINPTDYLPTGANISRALDPYLPEGYLQPQSEGEQFLDDFSTFAGSAINPLLGGSPQGLTQAATRGALGATGGGIARGLGLQGIPETLTKVGFASLPELKTLFTAPGQVRQAMTQDYNTAKEVGQFVPVPGDTIRKEMDRLIRRAQRLGNTPSSKVLEENATRLLNLADKNGNYRASDLVDFKQSINELFGKPAINKVVKEINAPILDSLTKVGEKFPLFGQSFFPAEESYKALNTLGRAQKFFSGSIPESAKAGASYYGISQLLKGNLGGAVNTELVTRGGKAAGNAAAKFFDFIERSSQGRQIYTRMLQNIGNDAKEPALKDLNHLNKLYEKDIQKTANKPKGNWKRVSPS